MDSETTIPEPTVPVINVPVPEGKVYKQRAIWSGTFIGGPLVATYMMAANFKFFGEKDKATYTWIIGIVYSIILFGTFFLLPDKIFSYIPDKLIIFIDAALAYYLVHHFQQDKIESHLNLGGKYFKWGRILIVSLIGAALTVIPILYVALIANPAVKYDSVKTYAMDTVKNQIHYNSYNISAGEIDMIAAAAMRTGYFTNKKGVALCVKKDIATYEITVPCNDNIKTMPDIMPAIIGWQKQLQDMLPSHKIVLLIVIDDDLDHVYRRIE